MRSICTIILCAALGLGVDGQYTYFNTIHGSENNDRPESIANVLVSGDEYITFGASVDEDNLIYYFFHIYSDEGEFLEEVPYYFGDGYVWTGVTNSFQRIPNTEDFFYAQAITDAEGTHGFIMRIGPDLDTLWTKKIDLFPPFTYFSTFAFDTDGFILAGEYDVGPGQRPTFIAKVDLDGEYLWHEVLHEPGEGSYRNLDLSPIQNGYMVSGANGSGANTEGYVEFIDEDGMLQWSDSAEGNILRGTMYHLETQNNGIIVSQGIGYADYPGATDPIYTYNQLQFYRVNLITEELEPVEAFIANPPWIIGGAVKIIESDSGLVFTGSFLKETDGFIPQISFILKTDYDFNIEWYTELAYVECPTCTNQLYDLELAPDGGYIMAGSYRDSETDPYDHTWLVKVDACGDVEWQGCEPIGPDGLWDFGPSRRSPCSSGTCVLDLYPNPASDLVRVIIPGTSASLCVIDITGKVVKEISNTSIGLLTDDEVTLDVSDLSSGLYSILLITDDRKSFTGKFVKE